MYQFDVETGKWVLQDETMTTSKWEPYATEIAKYIDARKGIGHDFAFTVFDYNIWQKNPSMRIKDDEYDFTHHVQTYATIEVQGMAYMVIPISNLLDLYTESQENLPEEQRDEAPPMVAQLMVNYMPYINYVNELDADVKLRREGDEKIELDPASPYLMLFAAYLKRDMLYFTKQADTHQWMLADDNNDMVCFAEHYMNNVEFKQKVDEFLEFMVYFAYNSQLVSINEDGTKVDVSLYYLFKKLNDPLLTSATQTVEKFVRNTLCTIESPDIVSTEYGRFMNLQLAHALLFGL